MKKIKRPEDKPIHIVLKVAMTVIFLWSGFFWSGVTVLQFFINNQEHRNLAIEFFTASVILFFGLLLSWLRLYIVQFIPSIIGFIAFLNPAREMIDHAAETGVIFKPSFELRYLPVIGFAILSLVLLILRVGSIVSEKSRVTEEYNNRPSESILDKHREE